METNKTKGIFNLIILDVDKDKLDTVSSEFANAFSLDENIANHIIKSAPIVFITMLTRQELKILTPKVVDLSSKGIEFRITARSVDKMPKVEWHIRPEFTVGSQAIPSGITFKWEKEAAFEIPKPIETPPPQPVEKVIIDRKIHKVEKVEFPQVKEIEMPKIEEIKIPKVEEEVVPELELVSDEELLPILDFAEELPMLESIEEKEIAVSTKSPLPPSEKGSSLEDIDLELLELLNQPNKKQAAEPLSSEKAKEKEIIDLSVQPEEIQVVEPLLDEKEELSLDTEGKIKEDVAEEKESVETYNVFLPQIKDEEKKQQAAKLIAEIKGISLEEATDLAGRVVIPILKGVPQVEAEKALEKFKKIGLYGTMTKKAQ